MRFLSNGDFNFPFEWATYWFKHFYMWSFQTGTPNPDGVIRLPGRILNYLVFGAFGNEAVAYFYAIGCLVVAFFAFFYFARKFLNIKSVPIQIVTSLLFALNPIFLGNMAKVGLVLAAALLPLILVFIKFTFERQQLRFLLLVVVCLNLSFLHPYTFIVNFGVAACYFIYLAWTRFSFIKKNLLKLIGIAVIGILMNAYFILAIASMGSVSKDAISTNVIPVAVDYTALLSVSNTGDLLTGLAMAKNVFLDFLFYDSAYKPIYFIGIALFYMLILFIFLRYRERIQNVHKATLALATIGFLILIALATTTIWHLESLIRILIDLPGGWAFRSPLKWQLYIPFAMATIVAILLWQVRDKKELRLYLGGFLTAAILMNGYIAVDVGKQLLTPRTLDNFSELYNEKLQQKTVLFINTPHCMEYMRDNMDVFVELNQVFVSSDTQLKRVLADSLDDVNLSSYDYLLSCMENNAVSDLIASNYDFSEENNFIDGAYKLYANNRAEPQIDSPSRLYAIEEAYNIGSLNKFVTTSLDENFNFITPADPRFSTTGLKNVFAQTMRGDVTNEGISVAIAPVHSGEQLLNTTQDAHYSTDNNNVTLSPTPFEDSQEIKAGKNITLSGSSPYQIAYIDNSFTYENLIDNPSLEDGLWQKSVSDCHNYDSNPDISMSHNQQQAKEGEYSLQLGARRHIACTGPQLINVEPGQQYFVSFDMLNKTGHGGVAISFNDDKKTNLVSRLDYQDSEAWQQYDRIIEVPTGATTMQILLYAYPDSTSGEYSEVLYDNLHVIETPPISNNFFITSSPEQSNNSAENINWDIINPTKKQITLTTNGEPFYLTSKETYTTSWSLYPAALDSLLPTSTSIEGIEHFKYNNTMNGWFITPEKLCATANYCSQNEDGSYEITFVMQFTPQQWLHVGLFISGIASVVAVTYFVFEQRREKKRINVGRKK